MTLPYFGDFQQVPNCHMHKFAYFTSHCGALYRSIFPIEAGSDQL